MFESARHADPAYLPPALVLCECEWEGIRAQVECVDGRGNTDIEKRAGTRNALCSLDRGFAIQRR